MAVLLLGFSWFNESGINKTEIISPQYYDNQFHNLNDVRTWSWQGSWSALRRWATEDFSDTRPDQPLPVRQLNQQLLEQDRLNSDGPLLYWLGHSSVLLYLDQRYWLIDPVFSDRASPFSFYGPQRFQPAPISVAQLPPLAGVIISHNHYDHLDQQTIRQLADKTEHFYLPLVVGQYLQDWGISKDKITELDWWQSAVNQEVTFVATPAQHFSGRGLFDRGESLWASWVIQTENTKIFFSGDSGYFSGFKQIGDRYGPFDITLLEAGAYDRDWQQVHMLPEQTIQAHHDLQGRQLLPIHNGVFDLAFHRWFEPYQKLSELAKAQDIELRTPLQGQKIDLSNSNDSVFNLNRFKRWWLDVLH
ncbi:MBL fold metallo-hydrolase [Pelagibaculum spongiae]|uniref:MBL fold metallo-hydrolase n=1 Tax=Pelagibaculum spongiae TaxID=2080658 RepID=UPI0019D43476|nr:MBL fold metallo-hydrolase [Pelagibaculum spongiae]